MCAINAMVNFMNANSEQRTHTVSHIESVGYIMAYYGPLRAHASNSSPLINLAAHERKHNTIDQWQCVCVCVCVSAASAPARAKLISLFLSHDIVECREGYIVFSVKHIPFGAAFSLILFFFWSSSATCYHHTNGSPWRNMIDDSHDNKWLIILPKDDVIHIHVFFTLLVSFFFFPVVPECIASEWNMYVSFETRHTRIDCSCSRPARVVRNKKKIYRKLLSTARTKVNSLDEMCLAIWTSQKTCHCRIWCWRRVDRGAPTQARTYLNVRKKKLIK